MSALVVVGSQWGDEGKGKIVDLLAKDADVIVRFQGGSNAGIPSLPTKARLFFTSFLPECSILENCVCWATGSRLIPAD